MQTELAMQQAYTDRASGGNIVSKDDNCARVVASAYAPASRHACMHAYGTEVVCMQAYGTEVVQSRASDEALQLTPQHQPQPNSARGVRVVGGPKLLV